MMARLRILSDIARRRQFVRAGAYAGFLDLWQGKRRDISARTAPDEEKTPEFHLNQPLGRPRRSRSAGIFRDQPRIRVLALYSLPRSGGTSCMRLFRKKSPPADAPNPDMERLVALLDHHKISTVFDVGANVGQYAQNLRKARYKGRIVSFEPLAQNHQLLEKLAASDPKWEIAPRMALGSADGEVLMNVSQSNDMSSILPVAEVMLAALPKSRTVETESVPLKKIDTIFSSHVSPGEKLFVKVDTQGFEMPVLEGAVEAMGSGRIAGWQLELSMVPLYTGEKTYEEIIAYLKEKGYETHFIIPGYFSKKLMRQLQIDSVFFKA
ncbi:MAG: methyltransferase, FkbM family domain protein [Verrucomicrobiales bacterium VVV1]|nr:MAG: methyltransferase, FkbM family domain protein [Verrucomicrobiales bacterium VVV1]